MLPTELRDIAQALGHLIAHGAQCRAMTIALPDIAELSRIAMKCQTEAAELSKPQPVHSEESANA